jgi:hypothetical protein
MKLKLPKRKREEQEQKPKFNFKTTKKAVKTPKKVIPLLEDKTREQLVDAWKRLHSRKKLDLSEKKLFEDIKMYLRTKYSIGV